MKEVAGTFHVSLHTADPGSAPEAGEATYASYARASVPAANQAFSVAPSPFHLPVMPLDAGIVEWVDEQTGSVMQWHDGGFNSLKVRYEEQEVADPYEFGINRPALVASYQHESSTFRAWQFRAKDGGPWPEGTGEKLCAALRLKVAQALRAHELGEQSKGAAPCTPEETRAALLAGERAFGE